MSGGDLSREAFYALTTIINYLNTRVRKNGALGLLQDVSLHPLQPTAARNYLPILSTAILACSALTTLLASHSYRTIVFARGGSWLRIPQLNQRPCVHTKNGAEKNAWLSLAQPIFHKRWCRLPNKTLWSATLYGICHRFIGRPEYTMCCTFRRRDYTPSTARRCDLRAPAFPTPRHT